MKLHLCDINSELIFEWEKAFTDKSEVTISEGNILTIANNTIVSPANSHGYMDGGIDRDYKEFFGKQIEEKVQESILRHPMGHLPIGEGLVVATGHKKIEYLIVAPTMLMPETTTADACFRAMKAALRVAYRNSKYITEIYCPGMGTGVGMVPPAEAAQAMAKAWQEIEPK